MSRNGSSVIQGAIAVLVAALVAVAPGSAAAVEVVTITDVTFDRFGTITESGTPQIAVWITCDGTGIIGDLEVRIEQRGTAAGTNLDLLDAPCTTTPTRYIVQIETFGELVFKWGKVRVISAKGHSPGDEDFATGQTIILRPKPLA